MSTRSIHFGSPMAEPTLELPRKPVQNNGQNQANVQNNVPEAPQKNPFEAYRDAAVDAKLIVETLRALFTSANRHGSLQIVLSAARRIEENAKSLLNMEEVA